MASTVLSTKMVLESADGVTGKKARYTLSCLTNGISDLRVASLADCLNDLRNKPYTNLYKVVDTEIN